MSNVPNLRTDGPLTVEDIDAFEAHARHVLEHPKTGDRPRRWDCERILRLCAALRVYVYEVAPRVDDADFASTEHLYPPDQREAWSLADPSILGTVAVSAEDIPEPKAAG